MADTKSESGDYTSADYYFDSYSHFGIHEEMLKDTVRTETYRDAIVKNPHLFEGKVVLDVGCGTGILSMFAAQAGAKKVIGVDCSTIAVQAKEIVAANGFADTITIIRGKVEEIELPVDKVDIIISEWMGYFLLYESMLDTVLYARDKWLVPGGLIFPDKASLYIAGIEDGEYMADKIHFWNNVYGFKMQPIKQLAMLEPLVDTVESAASVTTVNKMLTIDIATITKEELDFNVPYEVVARRQDFVHAMVVWFDVEFTHCHVPLSFSTGPADEYTHWKQTVMYLNKVLAVSPGDNIKGTLACSRNAKNPRDLDIVLHYEADVETGRVCEDQDYRLR